MQRLRSFPAISQHTMTVRLSDRTYRYRRTYSPRRRAWYVDIYDDDGQPILIGRRMVAQWTINGSLPVDLPGIIFVRGPEGYAQEELGRDLFEIFARLDDLTQAAVVDDEIEVVLS